MAILYRQDWDKYPTAIADDKTRNTSWLNMASKLKQMGVQHYYMPLALIQPVLQNYDPHDPNLPEEIVHLMRLECEINPWYFFRECFKVGEKGESVPLALNRGNLAMFWSVFNSFVTFVQQIRQTGKSLNTRAIVEYFHAIGAPAMANALHILFTKGDLRKEEIKAYKDLREKLPWWMWYLTSKDRDNQIEFTTAARQVFTKTYIPQGDPEAANGVGRGTTPDLVTVDEPPFLPYARYSIPALVAATTNSFDVAKRRGTMHALLYTTTAGDLSTDSGDYVYEKIKKVGMYFSEMLYDCKDRDDAVKMILANSNADTGGVPFLDISFSHLQLGYTDEWLRSKIGMVSGSRDQIKRDYLGQWTFGSARNPIKERILNLIRDHREEKPITDVTPENYVLRYFRPIEYVKTRKAVLGMDTSNAVGRDSITGVLTDVETAETLMAFGVSDTNLTQFTKWLAKLFVQLPNFTLIPEAKSSWDGIRDGLLIELPLLGVDPGRRIYSRIVDDANGTESQKRTYREYAAGHPSERKYFPFRADFGFPTSGPLRDLLYGEIMREATAQLAKVIRDPVLIDELSSLVEKNNRIDHKASGHDDYVIAWLLGQWFLRKARNVDHYRIDYRQVMCRVKQVTTGNNPKEIAHALKQERILKEIELLEARIAKSNITMEIKYLSTKLQSLKSEVTDDGFNDDNASLDRQSALARVRRQEQAQARRQGREGLFAGGLNHRKFR